MWSGKWSLTRENFEFQFLHLRHQRHPVIWKGKLEKSMGHFYRKNDKNVTRNHNNYVIFLSNLRVFRRFSRRSHSSIPLLGKTWLLCETWWWLCHGGCMTALFFEMVASIHDMIMVYSSYFHVFFRKKKICLSIFSRIVVAICHYLEHLPSLRGNKTSKLPNQQHWLKNTPGRLRAFFCDNQTARLY